MGSYRKGQPVTIEELLERVVVTALGCWIWIGGNSGTDREVSGSNYPRILRPGTRNAMAAHRYVFQTFKGEIPFGHDVDHICARWLDDPWIHRLCVNPDHLQATTPIVNQQLKIYGMKNGSTMNAPQLDVEGPACHLHQHQPMILAPGEKPSDVSF